MNDRPHSVLFLCTGNSARSQMAEALMNRKSQGKFVASSAGSHPASRVNPFAIRSLHEVGIDWKGHEPREIDSLAGQQFDFVITVCDNAREACPVLPGHPIHAHWGMEDPASVDGSDAEKSRAFTAARTLLARRIDLMLALPVDKLKRVTLGRRLEEIGAETEPARLG
jgi:protein-tyrosine-phosphatase